MNEMNELSKQIIYKGMTTHQVAELYDDTLSIPDFYALLQANREKASWVKAKLNPISDEPYGNEPIQKLDIYAPKQGKNLPVLIDIHGGGWAAGSKNARAIPAEMMLSQDVIWVPIDYGLAPNYRMQEMIHHVQDAVSWVYYHIDQYGGNPNQIYVTGQSAGAHLAATSIMPNWHQRLNVPLDVVKGLIVLSGIYDLNSLIPLPETETQALLKLSADEAMRFSPLFHLPQKNIPVIVAYGDQEPFGYRREAEEYCERLKQAGCDARLFSVAGANHFNMINELGNESGILFKETMRMIKKR